MAEWSVGGLYVTAYLVFSVAMMMLEQYLELRQYWKTCEKVVPPELKQYGIEVDEKEYMTTQTYNKDKRVFGIFKDWIMFFFGVFSLMYMTPSVWHYSAGVFPDDEYKCTLCWMFLQGWISKPLEIPFSLYSSFVLEEKHGFNKMTFATWISDLAKSELLSYVIGGLLIPLLIWVVKSTGERFYLYVWAMVQCLIFAFMWIYPNFIQPLFNKFDTLQDEELKKKIENLAADHKFPLTKLFQIDGSKRSSHSNAYFFGFWKNKRIVLYDTLLHLDHEDILAILCHELGHWKFNHTTMMLGISSAHIFILFYLFGVVMYSGESSQNIVRQFGYGETTAVMVSLMIFTQLFEPTEKLVGLFMTLFTRRNEFQADGWAKSCGKTAGLINGLKTIHAENKGELNPDPWYSWYHYSHPPLVERVRALGYEAPKAKEEKKGD
jgi:STE24 endopeptidase